MLKQIIRISAIVISVLIPTNSFAAPTCKDVITACDKALEEKNQAIKAQEDALDKCEQLNGTLREQLTDEQEKLNMWYRDPITMSVLGASVTAGIAVSPIGWVIGGSVLVISILK